MADDEQRPKVIQLIEHMPHRVSEVVCINCAYRWLAVRPAATKLRTLQCAKCQKQGYVIETGEILEDDGG